MFNQGKTLSTIQNIQRFMRWKITFTVISQSILSLRPTDTQNVRTAEALGSAPPAIQLHDQESELARKEAGKEKDNVCLTAGCIHTASKVLDAMDSTIEPCDDFYNFACGNFVKNTNIPDEKVSVNTFSIIGDLLQEQLRTLVSEETREDEAKPFRLAKNFFKACMNKSTWCRYFTVLVDLIRFIIAALIEERGLDPLYKVTEKLGGWPVVKGDSWDEDNWTWVEAVKKFRKLGYSMDYILDFSVGIDLKNSTQRTIDVR